MYRFKEIIKKYDVGRYRWGSMPSGVISYARAAFPRLEVGEEILLKDSDRDGDECAGYVVTDHGLYSNAYDELVEVKYEELDTVHLDIPAVYVNGRRFFKAGKGGGRFLSVFEQDGTYNMLHEIARSVTGASVSLDYDLDRAPVVSLRCAACQAPDANEKLVVTAHFYGPNFWSQHAHSAGLFSFAAALVAAGQKRRDFPLFTLRFCDQCWSVLKDYEEKKPSVGPESRSYLKSDSGNTEWIGSNRYFAIQATEDSGKLGLWFRSTGYAERIAAANNVQVRFHKPPYFPGAKRPEQKSNAVPAATVGETAQPEHSHADQQIETMQSSVGQMGGLPAVDPARVAEYESLYGRTLSPLEAAIIDSWNSRVTEQPCLYTFPRIPENKLKNARGACGLPCPDSALIIGLQDSTVWGSAKRGAIFTVEGVYWTPAGGKPAQSMKYREFEPSAMKYVDAAFGDGYIALSADRKLNIGFTKVEIVQLFKFLTDAARLSQMM